MKGRGIEVFVSYSQKDSDLREKLQSHLSALQHQGLIRVWHDRLIGAGEEWKQEIHDRLASADLFLLLVSDNFLASRYCYEIELPRRSGHPGARP